MGDSSVSGGLKRERKKEGRKERKRERELRKRHREGETEAGERKRRMKEIGET